MTIEQIEQGLWWWSAPHPEWTPAADKGGKGWGQIVSSYAVVAEEAFMVFDPLVPEGDEEELWAALDRDVEHHGPPSILITVLWHVRNSQQLLDRYEGATLWAHEPAAAWIGKRARLTNTFTQGDDLPGGAEALPMHHREEVAYWLPSHSATVVGDAILAHDGRAHLCPPSWLRKRDSYDELRRSVQRVLRFPGTRLLLTHGGPTDPGALQV